MHIQRLAAPLALVSLMSVNVTGANAAPVTHPASNPASPILESVQEHLTAVPEYEFLDVEAKAYATDTLPLLGAPYGDGVEARSLDKYAEFTLTGMNTLKYQRVSVDGETWYVDRDRFTTDKSVIESMQAEEEEARAEAEAAAAEEARIQAEQAAAAEAAAAQDAVSYMEHVAQPAPSYSEVYGAQDWDGGVLSASAGVNYGPSGKETYYNLDMAGVVQNMRNQGYGGTYWVRDDGVKMLGDYVLVAANLDTHPRGSFVETSLGTGIVADTGGFAYSDPNQVDIATAW